MNETRTYTAAASEAGPGGRRSAATSLFGGAILATVATASLAQVYLPDAIALSTTSISSGTYVALGGNLAVGDGGGGTFMPGTPGTSPCTSGDGGIVFPDGGTTCFYRADPTYSVREWGARCDVVAVDAAGAAGPATWSNGPSGSGVGTLTVPTALLSTPPISTGGQSIAISQIGSPTLWGSSLPAVSLTRFSTLSSKGAGYKSGNVVSFAGGTFSQQAAIVVDAVDGNGAITQSHFLWGGLYSVGSAATLTSMSQDSAHTYCGAVGSAHGTVTYAICGTISGSTTVAYGAVLAPAWSGWSVLNSQSIMNAGTSYAVGDIVTISAAGAVANPNHYATLVVEGTTTGGAITAYDWLDYGSFTFTASSVGTLDAISSTRNGTVGPGSNLSFGAGAWTQGPYASTISTVTTSGTLTNIVVNGTAAFPGTMDVQSFYYGTDDSNAITKALIAMPASALIIPVGCGTTKALDIMVDSSSNNANPSLVGSNLQSSGLYAFAAPPANRDPTAATPGIPVLSSVVYAGIVDGTTTSFDSAQGGGLRNMFVEGFGIPEGYGYFGLAYANVSVPSSLSAIPSGYNGPTFGTLTKRFNIPVAGTAVELDSVKLMRIDNVHISDGGIGMGNAALLGGIGESDPAGQLNGDVGSIVFTDSRLDSNPAFFAGPSNPDFALELHCHDSVFQNLTAFDGITADVLGPGGDIFGQMHVGSSAINATLASGAAPTIDWPVNSTLANVGFAGVASYGFYVQGNTSLSQTRCDIADIACVFLSVDPGEGKGNPGQVTDTQVGCAAFTSVPPGYGGVLLPDGALGATISGTAAAGKCAMPPAQRVMLGAAPDQTRIDAVICARRLSPLQNEETRDFPFVDRV